MRKYKYIRFGNITFAKSFIDQARESGYICTRRNNFKKPVIILNHGSPDFLKTHQNTILLNHPTAIKYCMDKSLTSSIISDFMPIHYTPESRTLNQEGINYPIIMKPTTGYHGNGIKIINGIDELNGLDLSRYVIQEYVKTKREYRFNILDSTIYQISRKEIVSQTPTRIKFDYISLGTGAKLSGKFFNYTQAVISQINNELNNTLSHYAIDILKAKSGRYFVAELNSAPGLYGLTFEKFKTCLDKKLEAGNLDKYKFKNLS